MVLAIIPPLWCLVGPFSTFPVLIGLLAKPLGLAFQTVSLLEDESFGPEAPGWVNACLSSHNQITDVSVGDQLGDSIQKVRAFAACGIIFLIFASITMCCAYTFAVLNCCAADDDVYVKTGEKDPEEHLIQDHTPTPQDPEARFYEDSKQA